MTRIVSWNMNGWGRGRALDEGWLLLLEGLQPDIALLQEAADTRDAARRIPSALQPALASARLGSVIISRVGDLERLWEDNSRGPVLVARSTIPGIGVVTVACLQAPVPEVGGVIRPLRETMMALRPLLTARFIVGGDLNTARQAHLAWPQYGHGEFLNDLEAWGLHEPLPLGGREQQSYWGRWLLDEPPTLGNTLQDDHVFVDEKTFRLVKTCRVLDTKRVRGLSDHGPVVVDLALPNRSKGPA
jgi:hypothetical protein